MKYKYCRFKCLNSNTYDLNILKSILRQVSSEAAPSIVMLRVMLEENSVEGAVSKSYEQSFAAFHGWATRTAVFASLPHLPTRVKLMKNLKENALLIHQLYILVQYIHGLFHSRESAKQLLEQI
ncbi:hypothetical protein PVL29_014835 [Vitis rotundifolia]|uniref:Glycolipid transfer protein domain-containing protein n=1 Tax=Vitis rotundifolia TaxID=103349 RepID=A0AA38ZHT5_VITRO|nr:hypothetical protein PVL29_014835 [Vitis rotundifolia]